MTYEKESYPFTPQEDRQIKPEYSLQHAMQDFEERMMTKVLHELRLHNQQLFFEESIKIEQRMIAFEDAHVSRRGRECYEAVLYSQRGTDD